MAEPDPSDLEFEQEGLRVCVERELVEPLNSRTLDVRESSSGRELVFR